MKGKYWLVVFLWSVLLLSCSNRKKISLGGDEPISIRDFIESFAPVALPYQVADTAVIKSPGDTLSISLKVLAHLIPDTSLSRIVTKTDKPKIYAIGRFAASNGETYLLIKALSVSKRSIELLCFDKKDSFVAAMHAMVPDNNPYTQQTFSIDKHYTISKGITRKNKDGTINDGKNVYVLNEPAKSFLLIMTDALDAEKIEVVNPIELLPRKGKYAADYSKDKWNLVSIRDNKKANRISFFVHFETKSNCIGEIRGEASFASSNTAIYRTNGDFCVLQFTFGASAVTISELQGCGSHRGVECVFEGTFPRKKEIKKKEIIKSSKKTK